MTENNLEKKEKNKKGKKDFFINKIKNSQENEINVSALNLEENKKIIVKNIPFNKTDSNLLTFFSRFANVVKVEIIKKKDGTSSGIGFVEFETEEEKRNILMMDRDDLILDGKRIDIRDTKFHIIDFIDNNNTIYVWNLSYSINEENLKKFFIDNIKDLKGDFKVKIIKDYNCKSQGYAYIKFEKEEDIANALKINGKMLEDTTLIVEVNKSREFGEFNGKERGNLLENSGIRGGARGRRNEYEGNVNNRKRSKFRSRNYERNRDRIKIIDKEKEPNRERERYREDRYFDIKRYKGNQFKFKGSERFRDYRNRERNYKYRERY